MYPALLASERYPVKRVALLGEMPPGEVLDMAREWGVIADVRVRTTRAEFPMRRKDATIYPVGEFSSVLTGPELLDLARDGELLAVRRCAVYLMGRPFAPMVGVVLAARQRAKLLGDKASERLAKLIANSLAGKLAQKAGKWVRYPAVDECGKWGETHELDALTGTVMRLRHVCGLAWRWDASEEHRGPHTAAFAYLGALGRLQMARIRALCPPCSVVSQDTDGIWCLNSAVEALRSAGMVGDGSPGQLRIVDTVDNAVFYGPRHYVAGERVVMAGMRDCHPSECGRYLVYSQRTPLFSARYTGAPNTVAVNYRRTLPPVDLVLGRLQEDGWVLPIHLIPGANRDER